jgi:Kdo2-lipid IVA lauroyltransferase/acyltransferase
MSPHALEWKGRLVLLSCQLLSYLPLGLLRSLGWLIGSCLIIFPLRVVATSRTNIARCLPHLDAAAQKKLLRQSLRELCMSILELPSIWAAPYAKLRKCMLHVEGEEILINALQSGSGVLIGAPHLGAWELLNLFLAEHTELTVLYKAPKLAWMEAVLNAARSRTRAKPIRADAQAVRSLLKTLQTGGAVGILPDQQPKAGDGEFAPMFGVHALTMTLFPKLAARAKVRTLFACCLRVPGGFSIVVREANPAATTVAALNDNVQSLAALKLAQYQWSYKRYSMRPEGEENFY